MIKLNYISVGIAKSINAILRTKVKPSNNRVLIYSPSSEEVTKSGIIIPEAVKEGKPRKGVVIMSGNMDEDNYSEMLQVGTLVTYGLYAGKEVEFDENLFIKGNLNIGKGTFSILDVHEIIMFETND